MCMWLYVVFNGLMVMYHVRVVDVELDAVVVDMVA